jgi:SAM-dependent methyltransferase
VDAVYLEHPEGRVQVFELGGGRRRISVEARDPALYVPIPQCETTYPLELIERILERRGAAWLCDDIARAENPRYVERFLRYAVLSYLPEAAFEGKRLLDFGCGSGTSTAVLARMFRRLEIVGVELDADNVELAEARRRHYGLTQASFRRSPDPASLPPDIGEFDFIMLSAVWEHLLPVERRPLARWLWSVLKPGGVLFLNQTPHRWYPIEDHTTSLPLLNYAPPQLAHWAANRFSKRIPGDEPWEALLRRGIRGGTSGEIMAAFRAAAEAAGENPPVLLEPSRLGIASRVDVWYAYSQEGRPSRLKALMRVAFKAVSRLAGTTFAPGVDLAMQKAIGDSAGAATG